MTRTTHALRRRELLLAGAALAASVPARAGETSDTTRLPAPDPHDAALLKLTAADALAALRDGAVTCERYTQALLDRAARLHELNAFIALEPDRLLEQARQLDTARRRGAKPGPLWGLPVPVKDSVFTRDHPTTAGTPALKAFRPLHDAPLVQRIVAAGGLVMGKTNLHELQMGYTSSNASFGAVRNPFDPSRIAGGSSGGTAAAVAACMAPLGIGSDTAGSIRVPAALCGVVGFRPTTGRYPTAGAVPLTPTFDQLGPICRTVGDAALFDSVLTGRPRAAPLPNLRGVRIGVPRAYFFDSVDEDVLGRVDEALRCLEDAGATLVEEDVPDIGSLLSSYWPILMSEGVVALGAFFEQIGLRGGFPDVLEQATPEIRGLFTAVMPGGAAAPSVEAYKLAVAVRRPALREALRTYFERTGVDAIALPPVRTVAAPIGEARAVTVNGKPMPLLAAYSTNTIAAPAGQLPAVTVPLGMNTADLPLGLELAGATGADERLLSVAAAVESAVRRAGLSMPA